MVLSHPIRVLIVHGDAVVREGLASTFGRCPDMQVVGAAADLEPEWILRPPLARPVDVVVADYDLGTALALRALRRRGPDDNLRILVIAAHNREWEIRRALDCGVRGYVVVGCALDELAAGVRALHRGVRHLSPEVALRLAEILAGESLTAREEQVLRLVVEGLGNKAIARRLDIAVGTVKSHLKGVFDKLNVESRTQAICAVERRGLLRQAPEADPPGIEAGDLVASRSARPSGPHGSFNGSTVPSGS